MKSKKSRQNIIIILSIAVPVLVIGSAFTAQYIYLQSKRNSVGYIPTKEQIEKATKYERVVFLGVDGAGSHFEEVDTPNFDKIFGNGSINYYSLTQFEADSAPNWTSMLHGVRYRKHRVHNGDSDYKPYTNDKYPSIYKIAKNVYPEMKGLSVANWPNFEIGIIENLDYVTKISTRDDDKIVPTFKEKFLKLDPKISFLCFDEADATGHAKGLCQDYYDALKHVDTRLGEVYDFLEANNKIDGTLFICAADHGHKKTGGHGFTFPVENKDIIQTTIAVNGNLGNIVVNGEMGKAVTQDVASIALYGLGIEQPSNFDGRVPYHVFSDLEK